MQATNKPGRPAAKAPDAGKFVKMAGGPTIVAKALNVQKQAVDKWVTVPPTRVLGMEKLLDGKKDRYDIRPDVFGRRPRVKKAS